MAIELKDVLHYYLGCEVSYDGKTWTLHMVSKKYAYLRRGKEGIDKNTIHLHEAKICLRPLSDMTEEERKEHDDLFLPSPSGQKGWYEETYWQARKTAWLLSKHFDLFDLISSGQAIDKTKL